MAQICTVERPTFTGKKFKFKLSIYRVKVSSRLLVFR